MTSPAAPGDGAGQNVTNIVKDCIQTLGSDAPQFSGKPMLLGGLSMAITARVPEPIFTSSAAMGWTLLPDDPSILYDTERAILEA